MFHTETSAFERISQANSAVAVRRWDDAAKDPDAFTPRFEWFRPLLLRLIDAHNAR
jgi:gamma-butyrobetaine dioxygenase